VLENEQLGVRLSVCECVEVGRARRLVASQHFVQQEFDADVRDRARRAFREAGFAERALRAPRQR
jgi:hypothetical protein